MKGSVCTTNHADVYIVDAFTKERYKGNPAAVVVLREEIEESAMQLIAAELNLSETAFVNVSQAENGRYPLRWFTPKVEVPLCGHATLATSKVLFDILGVWSDEILYTTKSGILKARKHQDGISMDFPLDQPEEVEVPQQIMEALGLRHSINCIYGKQTKKLIIHVDSRHEVTSLSPDFESMKGISFDFDIKGVGVTTGGQEPYDFISRYFNPWAGVNEDPVTGSVHTVLAPYWARLLGKNELLAYQESARGGELKLSLDSDGRVFIIGDAIIVLSGKIDI